MWIANGIHKTQIKGLGCVVSLRFGLERICLGEALSSASPDRCGKSVAGNVRTGRPAFTHRIRQGLVRVAIDLVLTRMDQSHFEPFLFEVPRPVGMHHDHADRG